MTITWKRIYIAGGADVPIEDGGTGQSTAQAAIDALSAVGAATNEHVLTKDTASGNAIFKIATGSGSAADAIMWAVLLGSSGKTVAGAVGGGAQYVHPNHSGDVTSVADGVQTIANKQTLSATAPITVSNTPTVIAGAAPVIAIPAATNAMAGHATAAHIQAIEANTAKNTNVSTALSVGTVNTNTVSITSDGGADDVTLPAATINTAGMLPTAKWAEIVANTAKVTNATHTGEVTGSGALTIAAAWTDYSGTSTVVGWAATPTITIWTIKIGKLVFVSFFISGTSNATNATFTVPYTAAAVSVYALFRAIDNTTPVVIAYLTVGGGAATVTLYASIGGGSWTASGSKVVLGQFCYVAQ